MSIQNKINSVMAPYGGSAALSVRDLDGKELVAIRATQAMKPASVAKLVSSACTLRGLGPEYQFETVFAHTGEVRGGVLHGDLVVHGSGDFSFVIEDLKMAIEAIRYIYGIKEIKGNLVFDSSRFEKPEWDNFDGFEGDAGRSFHAKMTAVPLNHNSFSVWVAPKGGVVQSTVFPKEADGIQLVNNLKIKPGQLRGSQVKLDYNVQAKRFTLNGFIGADDEPRAYYRAVQSPYESFARLFKFNYQVLGGVWNGSFEAKAFSSPTQKLWTHKSKPLSKLFMDINKLSTNFGSEMSLLAAAQREFRKSVGPAAGFQFLQNCMRNAGISAEAMSLENASGLSRQSRIQPTALTQFLSSLSQEAFWPEYLSSLSVLGQDGTTRSRLTDLKSKARLKTGSIAGVRTIAGYVDRTSGQKLAFALFLNCGSCDFSGWARVENEVLRLLIEES